MFFALYVRAICADFSGVRRAAGAAVCVPVEVGKEEQEREWYPHDEKLTPARVVAAQVHVKHDVAKARPELSLQQDQNALGLMTCT